ncbi:MAG: RNA polymerase sigma factor, partial [Planctomycetota bacterium]
MALNEETYLVQSALNGDLDSFGVLYERYYTGVVALAYSVVSDRHLAEDTAQESFAIACRDLHKLKSKDKFGPWIAGICRNVARQMLRRSIRNNFLKEIPNIEDSKREDGRSSVIRQAVWNLKPTYRELIVLRYYDNMSYEQIG